MTDEELLSNLDAGERAKLAHRKHATTEWVKLVRWAMVLAVIFGTLHECVPQVMDGYAIRQEGLDAAADLRTCRKVSAEALQNQRGESAARLREFTSTSSDEMQECRQRTVVPLQQCVGRLDALRTAVGQRLLESAIREQSNK